MNRIKEVLNEEGVQLKELANRLGVTRQALSRQVNNDLKVGTAERIASALNVPLWRLFASDEDVLDDVFKRKDVYCPHCGEKYTE